MATRQRYTYNKNGDLVSTENVEVPDDQVEQDSINDRVRLVVAKARTILADPAGSADWTVGERKVILAALIIRATR